MGAVRDLVEELRRRGVTVHEWPGWDGRGNADGGVGPRITQINPAGAVIHHTGSNYGPAYAGLVSSTRPELLGGCLCNFAGNEDGSLTVIASGLAWHAGPGVGPSLGPVLARIPNIRNQMNRCTVGLEIVYPGAQPMRKEQYKTALIFAKAVADLFAGGDLECVRAHAETNGSAPGGSGKWDPGCAPGRTIDMAAFRRDAALAANTPTLVIDLRGPEMRLKHVNEEGHAYHDRIYSVTDLEVEHITDPAIFAALRSVWGEPEDVSARHIDLAAFDANARRWRHRREIVTDVVAQVSGVDVDEEALGRSMVEGMLPKLTAALAEKTGATREDVEQIVRGAFRAAAGS